MSAGFDMGGSQGGGGPDEDPRRAEQSVLTHGLVSIAFGFALGLTLLIFKVFLENVRLGNLANIVQPLNGITNTGHLAWFVIGFVVGTVIAMVYNMLVFRKANLFGVDREYS